MNLLPARRPQILRDQIRALVSEARIPLSPDNQVVVVAVRGYYADSLGKPGENDRGFYDDALFIVAPDYFEAFNANTDPSVYRNGIATLIPGVWRYQPGLHGVSRGNPYPAFVQAQAVTVLRDGDDRETHGAPSPAAEDTGWFGINIHRGGIGGTSSLGCQTIPPAQWDEFHGALIEQLHEHGQRTFPYLLTLDPRLAPKGAK